MMHVLAALLLATVAQLQPLNEDNSVRFQCGPFHDEAGTLVTPQTVALSIDTLPVQTGDVPVNVWTDQWPADGLALANNMLRVVVPYTLLHLQDRRPGIQSQRMRATCLWLWRDPNGAQKQGKSWSDFNLLRNDAYHPSIATPTP